MDYRFNLTMTERFEELFPHTYKIEHFSSMCVYIATVHCMCTKEYDFVTMTACMIVEVHASHNSVINYYCISQKKL